MALNKKAGLQDVIFIMITLTIFGMIVLFGFKFMDEVNTKFQESGVLNEKGATATQQIRDMFPGVIDNSFLMLTVGMVIVMLVLAMLVAIHPVFFVFYFIMLMIVIFVSGALSNIYQQAAMNPEMAAIAQQLIYTSHIIRYLPIVVGVIGFILAIVLYRTYQNAV